MADQDITVNMIASGTVPIVATLNLRELPDFDDRLAAARERAGYELGDPSFADLIINAFLDPAADQTALAAEMED